MTDTTTGMPRMGGRWTFTLTRDFIEQLHALGPEAFEKWRRVGGAFFSDPFGASLKSELIVPSERIYSARLDAHYRLLFCTRKPNQAILCWVAAHDAAYDMARRLAVTLDDTAIPVVTIRHETLVTKPQPTIYRSTQIAGRLFNAWSDAELRDHGAPDEWISRMRQLDTLDGFLAYQDAIPDGAFDRLLRLLSPKSPSVLFTPGPSAPVLKGRERECNELSDLLLEPTIAMCCLVGSAGIGKSSLASWTAQQAMELSCQVRWLACRERRAATLDAWLAAISTEGPDALKSVLCSRLEPLDDRLHAALEFLGKGQTLLVFDDYDNLDERPTFDALILAAQRHAPNIKVLVTTGDVTSVSSSSAFPTGSVVITRLQGLDLAAFNGLIGASDLAAILTPQDRKVVWRKTYGNPGVFRQNQKQIRQQAWLENLESLDLEHAGWLIDTLSVAAFEAAERLAVAGPRISLRLARELLADNGDTVILGELVDKEVLRNPEPDIVVLDDPARALLLGIADPGKTQVLHRAIGEISGRLAMQADNPIARRDFLLLGLLHYDLAGDAERETLSLSAYAYDLLLGQSDWAQARLVAERALLAAEAVQNSYARVNWAVALAEHQIDREQLETASQSLAGASPLMPDPEADVYLARNSDWTRIRTKLLNQLGRLAYRKQDYDNAQAILAEVAPLAHTVGDLETEVEAMIRLGQIERRRGSFSAATTWLRQAHDLALKLPSRDLEFECLTGLGALARKQGDLFAASQYYQAAHRLAITTGDPLLTEMSLSQLGRLAQLMGDVAQAEVFVQDALRRAESMHNQRGIRIELTRLVDLLVAQGKVGEAEKSLAEAEQRNQQSGDVIGQAWNLKQRGQLSIVRGERNLGNALIGQGIEMLRVMGNKEYVTEFEAALNG